MNKDIQKEDDYGPEDYMKNFCIMTPTDIARHLDGTPCSYIHWEDKQRFLSWAWDNGIDPETLSGKELEELCARWKVECPDQFLDPRYVRTSLNGNTSTWEIKNRNDE